MAEHVSGRDEERLADRAERHLAQLLSIEPSPEFTARVRARISTEPAGGRRAWVWSGGVVIAATIVFAAALAMRHEPPATDVTTTGAVARRDTALSAAVPKAGPAPVVRHRPVAVSARLPQAPKVGRAAEPEVLIDPEFAESVRRLAAEQPALSDVPPEPALDPVVVEPLKVPDIVVLPADSERHR
jgi:hypothetical protein